MVDEPEAIEPDRMEVEWRTGVVAIVDALGVSGFGRRESEQFLEWLGTTEKTLRGWPRSDC